MKAIFRNLCRTLMDREGKGHLGGEWSTNLIEQFDILPAASQGATVSNMWDLTGAGTPAVAFATDGGGITITNTAGDAGADNDAGAIFPLATGAWSVSRLPDGTRKHRLSSKIKTGASVANYCIQWGFKLTDTAVYATDADQVMIVFDTDAIDIDPATGTSQADIAAGSTTFYVVFSNGTSNADYAVNTGVTVAASTTYDFAIEIGTDSRAHVFINGAEVNLSALPAMRTTAALKPTARVLDRDSAGVTKSLTIRQFHYLGK
jgi:hypothetical protein